MELVACEGCGVSFQRRSRRGSPQKYCTRVCRVESNKRKHAELYPRTGLATGTRGAISELVVAVDLLWRGMPVFRAVSPACPCDLAVIGPSGLVRIEVRSAVKMLNGTTGFSKCSLGSGRHDVLALVFADGSIEYRPPIEEWR